MGSLYPSNWPENPFHEGEVIVQKRLGTQEKVMSYAPRFIRPYMPDQHRDFYKAQPMLVFASRDRRGKMWATMVSNGTDKMTTSPDPKTLHINASPIPQDALYGQLQEGSDVGILGIEFATKRRNRVNGRILKANNNTNNTGLIFQVGQSYGNCPQYIKPRQWWSATDGTATDSNNTTIMSKPESIRFDHLTDTQMETIRNAETIFVATGYRDETGNPNDPRYGNDASHRGGPPGFVRVIDSSTVILPDYPGNLMYNTIGNLEMDARIGISFPQFETGGMIQVTGRATMEFDSQKAAAVDPGAERLIYIHIEEVVEIPPKSFPIQWSSQSSELQERKLVVSAKIRESKDVMSFYLRPQNNDLQTLWKFQPGQHLPISVSVDPFNAKNQMERTYSISGGSSSEYRISVKRQGKVSSYLHDRIDIGDTILAKKPAGDFVLQQDSQRPVLLLSNGIGVTPMMSMLHHWANAFHQDQQYQRPLYWVHGARDSQHHSFVTEVDDIQRVVSRYKDALTTHVSYSRPLEDDRRHDSQGRLTVTQLQEVLPDLAEADIYICGTDSFVADMEEGLLEKGVPSLQIHYETF